MSNHLVKNGQLLLERNDGDPVFRLDIPGGWTNRSEFEDDWEPLLFQSPDSGAMIGFLPNSQFDEPVQDAQMLAFAGNLPYSEIVETLAAPSHGGSTQITISKTRCYGMNIGKLQFKLNDVDYVNINGIRFIRFTGLNYGAPCEAYFAHVGTAENKLLFDGFVCVYLNESAFEQHNATIKAAINSIQRG